MEITASKPKKDDSFGVRLAALQEPSVSLRSRIIETLRRAIEAGVLAPGARLTERELCEQLKVSRTSLREALGELQAEDILTYSPTRRLSVTVISRSRSGWVVVGWWAVFASAGQGCGWRRVQGGGAHDRFVVARPIVRCTSSSRSSSDGQG